MDWSAAWGRCAARHLIASQELLKATNRANAGFDYVLGIVLLREMQRQLDLFVRAERRRRDAETRSPL